MKLRNKTTENQKGFISTKVLAASGFALTAALTGSFVYASLGVPMVVGEDLASGDGDVCVSAHWADDFSVNSRTGNCEGIDTSLPGDESNEDGADKVLATHTCGPAELKITQSMQDHSDKNEDLNKEGKPMIPYPGGGWSIIVDLEPLGAAGSILTTDGEVDLSFSNARNDSGFVVVFGDGSTCRAHKMKDGVGHSDDGPATVSVSPNSTIVTYMKEGFPHREGDLPATTTTTTFDNGVIANEEYIVNNIMTREGKAAHIIRFENGEIQVEIWKLDGNSHRLDGPAEQTFNKDKILTAYHFYINGNLMTDKDSWIEAGGLPSAWID